MFRCILDKWRALHNHDKPTPATHYAVPPVQDGTSPSFNPRHNLPWGRHTPALPPESPGRGRKAAARCWGNLPPPSHPADTGRKALPRETWTGGQATDTARPRQRGSLRPHPSHGCDGMRTRTPTGSSASKLGTKIETDSGGKQVHTRAHDPSSPAMGRNLSDKTSKTASR